MKSRLSCSSNGGSRYYVQEVTPYIARLELIYKALTIWKCSHSDIERKEPGFYANKLPCKRTTLSYVYKWFWVISPANLDFKINLNICYQSSCSRVGKGKVDVSLSSVRLKVRLVRVGRIDLFESSLIWIGLFVGVGWSPILNFGLVSIGCRSLVLAIVLFAPLCFWLRCSARSLFVVPSLSLVFRIVVLGVASLGNQRCSPRCWSSGLRASSLLRAPGCDETTPQYVSSLCDSLDFEWGVLSFESHSRWSMLDGWFVFSPRS